MKNSKLFRLNLNDLLKGGLVATITAVLTIVLQVITDCGINCIDYKQIATVSITTFAAYLLKNISTNENNELLKK